MKKVLLFAFSLILALSATITVSADDYKASIERVIEQYFEARLVLPDAKVLSEIANKGTLDTELERYSILKSQGIKIESSEYEIIELWLGENWAEAYISEIVTYTVNGKTCTETVLHYFGCIDYSGIITSDSYREEFSGFSSSSYVPEELLIKSNIPVVIKAIDKMNGTVLTGEDSLSQRKTTDYKTCIIDVASDEIGYIEKHSNSQLFDKTANPYQDPMDNYTKYQYLLGHGNGSPWCYYFVSWCARTAGVSTSVLPTESSTSAGFNWYSNEGRIGNYPNYTP